MSHRYTIGGIELRTEEFLPDLDSEAITDVSVEVRFIDREFIDQPDSTSVRSLVGPGGLRCAIDIDTPMAWLPDDFREPSHRAWQLRQMAPIFSILLVAD